MRKRCECDYELEQMLNPMKKRKDSSFYNHDRPNYSILEEKNKYKNIIIKQN